MSTASEAGETLEPTPVGWQRLGDVIKPPMPGFEDLLFLPSLDNQSSNIYVLPGDYVTIVDPGNDYTAFMELFSGRARPEDVRKLAVTHGHFDHIMGALEFLRTYRQRPEGASIELILHEGGPDQIKNTAREYGCSVTEVKGGETVELSGLSFDVIYTPGHTIDGIAFYHAPTKTVFSGDVVLPLAVAGPDPKAGGSLDQYLFGLRALLKREIENLLPGHGPVVGPGARKVVEDTYEAVLMKLLGSEKPIPWIQGAMMAAERGLLEEAVFCCDKELAKSQANEKALKLKALCLNDLGRSGEALEVFSRLRGLGSPEDAFLHVGTGYALMGLGEYAESIKCFDAALKLKPYLREALVYKGMALHLMGNHDEAMDIEPFRTEFMGRFRTELLRASRPAPMEGPGKGPEKA